MAIYVPGTGYSESSQPGSRSDPLNPGKTQQHKGIDYAAAEGTPISAAAEGEVVYSGENVIKVPEGFIFEQQAPRFLGRF